MLEACAFLTYPLLREEVKVLNLTTSSHAYRLSRKTSYDLHLSDLIGTDSLYNCSAWFGISFPLLGDFVYLFGTALNASFRQVT